MLGEIADKAAMACQMFWQSLSTEERRALAALGIYLGASLYAFYREASRARERERLIEEVKDALAS